MTAPVRRKVNSTVQNPTQPTKGRAAPRRLAKGRAEPGHPLTMTGPKPKRGGRRLPAVGPKRVPKGTHLTASEPMSLAEQEVELAMRKHGSLAQAAANGGVDALLVQGAQDHCIYLIDSRGLICTWNQGASRLTGYLASEAVGLDSKAMFVEEDREAGKPARLLREADKNGTADDTGWLLRKDGTRIWVTGTIRGLRDHAGVTQGFVKVCQDSTAEREAQEEVRRSKAELLQFQAIVSHEIGNQITPLRLQLNILARKGLPEHQRSISIAERAVARLERLGADIGTAAKLHSGRFKVESGPVDLAQLLVQEADSVREEAERQGIRLSVQSPSTLACVGDGQRISQVLQNLLSNAVKFSERGSVVRLIAAASGDRVTISVTDHGRGLSPEQLAQLFVPFSRPHSDKPGTGLGLHLSRRIVETLGGQLTASSEGPGRGATFSMTLPSRGP